MNDKHAPIIQAVEQLNAALSEVTPYRLVALDPKEIKLLDKNPHYMPKKVFDQLTDNIKHDGNLSSLPLLWKQEDGSFECLSGNHRVQAAVAAKTEIVLCLYTDKHLSLSEKRAIQLSHNALIGKDDPNLLREVWTEIDDLAMKVYSGLDENTLDTLPKVDVITLQDQRLYLERLELLFVPTELGRIEELVKEIGEAKHTRFAARLEDWDRFFECLLRLKETEKIVNSAVAILVICEIVEAYLEAKEEADNSERNASELAGAQA